MTETANATADKIKTIRAYYKLCQKPENRGIVLKDDSSDVIRYTVKILVLLTEQSDNIEQLLKSTELLPSLTDACENITNPSVNYNLVLVSSRIRAVKNSLEARRAEQNEPLADAVKELDKGGGTLHRKFVARKSKQIIMEFDVDEFDEAKKRDVERSLLKKKGVISVYITESPVPRAVLRTIPSLEAKEIALVVFAAGFEYVAQIVKMHGGGGEEEKFEMYASEAQNSKIGGAVASGDYPEYLDDDVLHVDPASFKFEAIFSIPAIPVPPLTVSPIISLLSPFLVHHLISFFFYLARSRDLIL
ncbi:Protein CBG19746 [Caenorhabditis briggsae]|uniref:Armadillo repeat-containing protein 1 n=1 Tax=Caenorhabditis briggsae TaxID=6238 RepID=A8XWE8_CAEBR|nr:Protein CBG19746 [Caenorhabditis briggsae]CAP36967.2 Protein CBG19746 [Caenorhabditis briggsae]